MPTATSSSAYSTITAPLYRRRARVLRIMTDDPPGFTRATNLPMEIRSQRNSEKQSRSEAKPRKSGFLHCSLLRLGQEHVAEDREGVLQRRDQLALIGEDRGGHERSSEE